MVLYTICNGHAELLRFITIHIHFVARRFCIEESIGHRDLGALIECAQEFFAHCFKLLDIISAGGLL